MADVYWEKVEVFRHPGKIALFLGFFPQIMEGPISSYAQTADTLFEGNPLTMENLAQGSVRIFWGLFKKLLIADRLYLLVDVIFNNYQYHYGEMIVDVYKRQADQLVQLAMGLGNVRATIQALGEAQAQLDTAEQTARQQFDAAWNELNEGEAQIIFGKSQIADKREMCIRDRLCAGTDG